MSEPTHLETMRVNLAQCEEALQLGIHDPVDRKFTENHAADLRSKIQLEEWTQGQEVIRARGCNLECAEK